MTMPRSYEMIFMRERPAEVVAAVHASSDEPGKAAYAALVETCADCLAAGRLRPELTDPLAVAQAIWSAVHGMVALLLRTEDVADLQWRPRAVVLDTLMTMICRGVLR